MATPMDIDCEGTELKTKPESKTKHRRSAFFDSLEKITDFTHFPSVLNQLVSTYLSGVVFWWRPEMRNLGTIDWMKDSHIQIFPIADAIPLWSHMPSSREWMTVDTIAHRIHAKYPYADRWDFNWTGCPAAFEMNLSLIIENLIFVLYFMCDAGLLWCDAME